jgi:hypothetical protein
MITDLTHLSDSLRQGRVREHSAENVELKSDWQERYGQKLSALANKQQLTCTWMVVGVADDGTVTGQPEDWARQTEQVISQQINRNLDPLQSCTKLTCEDTGSGWVVVIGLCNPGAVVYWASLPWAASGTTVERMTPERVMEYTMTLPGLNDHSTQPWAGVPSVPLAERFVQRLRSKRMDDASLQTGSAYEVLDRLHLAQCNAARILFGDATYRLVCYDQRGEPLRNDREKGVYKLLLDESHADIQDWSAKRLGLNGVSFAPRGLAEALANAVAHAAYFEQDGDILVEVHPEKVSISNLCLPGSAFFANQWFSRNHKSVNPLLMEALRLTQHVDDVGRGKGLIFTDCLRHGKPPPSVTIEQAGRYSRWRLTLHGGRDDERQLRLLEQLRANYRDEQKALLAHALVLWRGQPLASIRRFVDEAHAQVVAEIFTDQDGPVFYSQKPDRVYLRRWARVLVQEGKDSKALAEHEEEDLYRRALVRAAGKAITTHEIRRLAAMGDSNSARSITSKLLTRWHGEKRIERVKRGVYRFPENVDKPIDFADIIRRLAGVTGALAKLKR